MRRHGWTGVHIRVLNPSSEVPRLRQRPKATARPHELSLAAGLLGLAWLAGCQSSGGDSDEPVTSATTSDTISEGDPSRPSRPSNPPLSNGGGGGAAATSGAAGKPGQVDAGSALGGSSPVAPVGAGGDGETDGAAGEASAGAGGRGTSEPAGTNGGSAGQGAFDDRDAGPTEPELGDDAGAEPGVQGIIGVGYGGLRIVSRDLGATWQDETHWSSDGGDDHDLLRTIAYGNGVWLSGGWRLTTSNDGVDWHDLGDAEAIIDAVNCPVTDGMAFGAGKFLVACGSMLAASVDGLSWERVGPTPDVGGHPYLFYDAPNEQFACSGDDGASFVSSDGLEWQPLAIDTVHWCAGGLTPRAQCPSFYHDGVFLSAEWGGLIRRSTDGADWSNVYSDDFGNNLFTEYAFAVGRVAP